VRATARGGDLGCVMIGSRHNESTRLEPLMGVPMNEDHQLLLTALTLVLAKQIRAEAAAADQPMTADPIEDAVNLIKQHRVPITGRFGVPHL
jgi:hypothetical protein